MANAAINLLVDEPWPIAVDSVGRIWNLAKVDGQPDVLTATRITSTVALKGGNRPTFTTFQATPFETKYFILAAGRELIKVTEDEDGDLVAAELGGDPPFGKFVQELNYRVLISGYNDLDFTWSDLEEAEEYPKVNGELVNVNRVQKHKGDERIENMIVFKGFVYFFKTHSIEIWQDIGQEQVFARRNTIEKGCQASYSVVQANDTLYWFGDDGQFYKLDGLRPQIISTPYWRELHPLKSKENIVGHDFRKEAVIRWSSFENNRCFNYDYKHEIWSEDNLWEDATWKSLPFNAYMEWEGEQYIGDHKKTGKIYHWSREYLTDNGTDIRVYRHFQFPTSPDGRSTKVNRMRFRVCRGQGRSGIEEPLLFVRWNFDQGEWNHYENLSLGQRGEWEPYIDLYGIGVGSEMGIELIETDAVDYFVSDLFMTGEPLGI
jgi:hypothetical protein